MQRNNTKVRKRQMETETCTGSFCPVPPNLANSHKLSKSCMQLNKINIFTIIIINNNNNKLWSVLHSHHDHWT